jgi:hypothetical protein
VSRREIVEWVGDEPVTARQLARKLGCSPKRVRAAMRRMGVRYTEQRPRRYYKAVRS